MKLVLWLIQVIPWCPKTAGYTSTWCMSCLVLLAESVAIPHFWGANQTADKGNGVHNGYWKQRKPCFKMAIFVILFNFILFWTNMVMLNQRCKRLVEISDSAWSKGGWIQYWKIAEQAGQTLSGSPTLNKVSWGTWLGKTLYEHNIKSRENWFDVCSSSSSSHWNWSHHPIPVVVSFVWTRKQVSAISSFTVHSVGS